MERGAKGGRDKSLSISLTLSSPFYVWLLSPSPSSSLFATKAT